MKIHSSVGKHWKELLGQPLANKCKKSQELSCKQKYEERVRAIGRLAHTLLQKVIKRKVDRNNNILKE